MECPGNRTEPGASGHPVFGLECATLNRCPLASGRADAPDDRERTSARPGRTLQAPLRSSVRKHVADIKIILEGRQLPQTEEVKDRGLYIHTEPRNSIPMNGVHSIPNQAANQESRKKA
ncbi:hypothetical protein HPB50_018827 [Hyalomma asiaticum]|uniref:Uncharacterized protein n=1 Tax=Hyalomma asiaticum TaxID=266040 RepID=A0ACB7RXH3_HYAAI|nr:hypothetical protein HPB50_018827 [Hyalomma asiaticum]